MRRLALCAAIAGVVACGGRYEESGFDGGRTDDPSSSIAAAGSGGSSGRAGASYGDPTLPSHDLGACAPGFARTSNPSRPCNWLTDMGICFDSNDDACACICPKIRNSVCFSPFYPGPGMATPIHCD
jgi:hypothetical protein